MPIGGDESTDAYEAIKAGCGTVGLVATRVDEEESVRESLCEHRVMK